MDYAAIITRAQVLLRNFTLALREDGAEVCELLDSGVPHHTVAALYPYEPEAWQAGYERLILTGPVPRKIIDFDGQRSRIRMVRPQRRPEGLSRESWNEIQRLAKRMSSSSPYLSEIEQASYRAISRRITIGGPDNFTHVSMLVMLLHVLASAPEAERDLRASPGMPEYATTVLNAAQTLTADSLFHRRAPLTPQPCSD